VIYFTYCLLTYTDNEQLIGRLWDMWCWCCSWLAVELITWGKRWHIAASLLRTRRYDDSDDGGGGGRGVARNLFWEGIFGRYKTSVLIVE